MAQLMANSAGLSASQLAQQKDDLKRKHKLQLADFDALSKQMTSAAEREVTPYIEVGTQYYSLVCEGVMEPNKWVQWATLNTGVQRHYSLYNVKLRWNFYTFEIKTDFSVGLDWKVEFTNKFIY